MVVTGSQDAGVAETAGPTSLIYSYPRTLSDSVVWVDRPRLHILEYLACFSAGATVS